MRPDWESGLRGRLYALGRRAMPLAVAARAAPPRPSERLLGLRKPAPELARLPLSTRAAPRPGRADVLVLPVIAWSYRRQRPQQLAEALARRGRRVFYGSLRGLRRARRAGGRGARRHAPADRGRPPRGSLADRASADGPRARRLLGSRRRERFDAPRGARCSSQSPFWAPARRGAPGALRLADRLRLSRRARGVPDEPAGRLLADAERDLAAAADLVVATSEPLRAAHGRLERRIARLLPNACDFALFATSPAHARSRARLTVGYVGAVDEWFDMELLAPARGSCARLALRDRGRSRGRGASTLPRLPNVVFHGERPHREMPELPRPLRRRDHPVPALAADARDRSRQALRGGRRRAPVVATPMRIARAASPGGASCASPSTPRSSRARSRPPPPRAADGGARARDFARENTWDVRARDARRLVDRPAVPDVGREPKPMSRDDTDAPARARPDVPSTTPPGGARAGSRRPRTSGGTAASSTSS